MHIRLIVLRSTAKAVEVMIERKDVVRTAREWIGTPYQHQASCRGAGADCLGLVRGIWRDVVGGEPADIPPYSYDWSEQSGREVLWHAARQHLTEVPLHEPSAIGQVLLFRMKASSVAKHLGLIERVGVPIRFIHSFSGHGVVVSDLTGPWQRLVVARFEFPFILEGR